MGSEMCIRDRLGVFGSGGESGDNARVMDPQWARLIRDECKSLGIAFFHKQWGSYKSNPAVFELGKSAEEARKIDSHGKGGSLIDGKPWKEFPDMKPPPRRMTLFG